MALEISKIVVQIEAMGEALARRHQEVAGPLEAHAVVTRELFDKIGRARREDRSWRGAEPVDSRMDERHSARAPVHATLIAVDGSQTYPNRHGIALFYLLNIGGVILRQGSGEAPETNSSPEVFFEEDDLFDKNGRLRDTQFVNRQRDRREMQALARLAEEERATLGGDTSRPIVALLDGPLLAWAPRPELDGALSRETDREVHQATQQLDRLRAARAIPIGYVDRPSSANVLRTLELAQLPEEQISRESLRTGPYRRLADRQLFADLEPGQRSALFASTSDINARYADRGHRILFFYANMGRQAGPATVEIARFEVPEWAASDPQMLDLTQAAIYADCELGGFPYVLMRAHELAVVSTSEREEIEQMLAREMWRHGVPPMPSAKSEGKLLTAHPRMR